METKEPRYLVDDATIRRIGKLFREGYGSRLIGDMLDMNEYTVERIVAGKTQAAVRVLGGSLTGGKKRPAKLLARSWEVSR